MFNIVIVHCLAFYIICEWAFYIICE